MENNEITFLEAIKNGYRKWDDSTGRTSLKEYGYFFLFNLLILPLKLLLYFFCVSLVTLSMKGSGHSFLTIPIIFFLWMFIDYPLLNATKRRLTDAGFSKRLFLLGIIAVPPVAFYSLVNPILCVLGLIALCCLFFMLFKEKK